MDDSDIEDLLFLAHALQGIAETGPNRRFTILHWNKHEGTEVRLDLALHADTIAWQLEQVLSQSGRWRGIVETVRACLAKDE